MAGQTLEHTGAAIVEEYYPPYATEVAPTYPLYSTSIYVGSVILLLSMSMLGLPITAIFLLGLFICMYGFRKHGREDAH